MPSPGHARPRLIGLLLAASMLLVTAACGDSNEQSVPPHAIAYLGVVSEQSKLAVFLVGPDGSGRARLTRDAVNMGRPAWSPDGSKLALVDNTILFVLDADGSNLHRLTREEDLVGGFAWSPDGKRIAYEQTVPGETYGTELHVVDVGSRRQAPGPFQGEQASWSPDGRKLAFVRCRSAEGDPGYDCDLWASDPDGDGGRRLVAGPGAVVDPQWSPAAGAIAFLRFAARDRWKLELVDPRSRSVRTVANRVDEYTWSPDGRRLRFVRDDEVWSVAADGAHARRLFVVPHDACAAALSPSGTALAYQRPCRADSVGVTIPSSLWVVRLDGGAPQRIARHAEGPAWRPLEAARSPT